MFRPLLHFFVIEAEEFSDQARVLQAPLGGVAGLPQPLHALICSCAQSIEAVISRHRSAVARHSQYSDRSGRRQRADNWVTFVIADEFADAATADEKRAADFTLQPTRIRRSDMNFIRAELTANDFAAATLDEGGARC